VASDGSGEWRHGMVVVKESTDIRRCGEAVMGRREEEARR
jgi:hypothetical protein